MIAWLTRVAAWGSQTVNLFLLFGHHDQTVSARAWQNRDKPGWKQANKAINSLFFWQENHTEKSFKEDEAFAREVIWGNGVEL